MCSAMCWRDKDHDVGGSGGEGGWLTRVRNCMIRQAALKVSTYEEFEGADILELSGSEARPGFWERTACVVENEHWIIQAYVQRGIIDAPYAG